MQKDSRVGQQGRPVNEKQLAGERDLAMWVKDIEGVLSSRAVQAVFHKDPRRPVATIVRLLSLAAMAFRSGYELLATDLVRQALNIIEAGIEQGYYSRSEVASIIDHIKSRSPIELPAVTREQYPI